MKKLLFLSLIMILAVSLTACDNFALNFVDEIGDPQEYTASGSVLRDIDDDSSGIANVTVDFEGEGDAEFSSVQTDQYGKWGKTGLHGKVQVFPRLDVEAEGEEPWNFSPANRTISFTTDDRTELKFEGNQGDLEELYSVSGWVLRDLDDDTSGIPDVTITFAGEDEMEFTSVQTGSDGYWEKSGLRGNVTITPRLGELDDEEGEGWHFSPANKSVNINSSNLTEISFEGTPVDTHQVYSASGKIINTDGEGMTAVVIEFLRDDEVIGTAITENGDWTKERLWGTVTVKPVGIPPDYKEQFSPVTTTISTAETRVDFVGY